MTFLHSVAYATSWFFWSLACWHNVVIRPKSRSIVPRTVDYHLFISFLNLCPFPCLSSFPPMVALKVPKANHWARTWSIGFNYTKLSGLLPALSRPPPPLLSHMKPTQLAIFTFSHAKSQFYSQIKTNL